MLETRAKIMNNITGERINGKNLKEPNAGIVKKFANTQKLTQVRSFTVGQQGGPNTNKTRNPLQGMKSLNSSFDYQKSLKFTLRETMRKNLMKRSPIITHSSLDHSAI